MLRSMSQGRAIYSMQFGRYDEAPRSVDERSSTVQEQIVEAAKGKAGVPA